MNKTLIKPSDQQVSEYYQAIMDTSCPTAVVKARLAETPALVNVALNDAGDTGLHVVARLGRANILRIMLAVPGVDVERWNKLDETPLLTGAWSRAITEVLAPIARKDAHDWFGLTHERRADLAFLTQAYNPKYDNVRALDRWTPTIEAAVEICARSKSPLDGAAHLARNRILLLPCGPSPEFRQALAVRSNIFNYV